MDQSRDGADQSVLAAAQDEHSISFQLFSRWMGMAEVEDALVCGDQNDGCLHTSAIGFTCQDTSDLEFGLTRAHQMDSEIHGLSAEPPQGPEPFTLRFG